MPPVPGKNRTKIIDGETRYLCLDIDHMAWLDESEFYKVKRKFPFHPYCKACCSRRKKIEYARKADDAFLEAQRVRQRERRRRVSAAAHDADRHYDATFRTGASKDRGFIKLADVLPYYNMLMAQSESQNKAAESSGVQTRTLRRIKTADTEWVEFETAEKIALAVGLGSEFIADHLPVLGRPGWSRAGHIHCVDCGTYWHPHQGKGRCIACYAIFKGHTTAALPRDQQGWTKMYSCCVVCKRTDRRHQGRGLCYACRSAMKKAGRLDEFAPKTNRRPDPKSWAASAEKRRADKLRAATPQSVTALG